MVKEVVCKVTNGERSRVVPNEECGLVDVTDWRVETNVYGSRSCQYKAETNIKYYGEM